MKNITIILPIHKLDDSYKEMLGHALLSTDNFYNDAKLLIVAPEKLKKEFQSIKLDQKIQLDYLFHNEPDNFCNQVNLGIKKIDTEWFSILEIDDEYNKNWLINFNNYLKHNSDVDVFLPVVKDIDKNGAFISFTNESVWAYGFSDKQGFLDNEILLEFENYQISGGIYKTSKIIELGGLKDNIKLTFGYEFLLRLSHNGVKIMVIPRIGYRHVNLRNDSLFWNYQNLESEKFKDGEAKFWLETAKKEFFYTNKREITYVN